MVAIDDAHYLIATWDGLLKTTKDKLLKNYYKRQSIRSICHVADSLYLLGIVGSNLVLWDEQKGEQVIQICNDLTADSIKRVLNSNKFIIKSESKGV